MLECNSGNILHYIDFVIDMLARNNVSICCLQETEVQVNFPEKLLNCGGFTLELEQNTSNNMLVFT